MRKAGRPLHPDDLPPALGWESGAWWLYLRVQTQWRIDPLGRRIGLDYSPAISIINSLRWDVPWALTLLQLVERQALVPESENGESGDD